MPDTFNKYPTALEVVQNVQGQLGLPVSGAAFGNATDQTAQQLLALLNQSGRRLIKPTAGYRWTHMLRTWELATTPTETLYDMPTDWDSFEDLTGWNFTSRLPMLGPATDQQWQTLKARNLGSSTISVIYRTRGGKFEIYNTFPDPQDLRIDYSSRAWVVNPSTNDRADRVMADDDLCLYDADLLYAKVKLAFLIAKGFDSTAAQAEYNDLEEAAINADTDAPILTVTRSSSYPLINVNFNVPDSGYGG